MRRVGLTGGIATGKSYVRSRIEARGIPTIDADRVVHALLQPNTAAAAAIARRFGPSVMSADGAIDRRALGRVVFGDSRARAELEAILHPLVYERVAQWMVQQATAGGHAAVADIPLLFETGHEGDFDLVVVVACEPGEQLRRIIARDGFDADAARARLAAQWPIERKVERADVVIRTDGTFGATDHQVDALCRLLR